SYSGKSLRNSLSDNDKQLLDRHSLCYSETSIVGNSGDSKIIGNAHFNLGEISHSNSPDLLVRL
ncbi:MAG: hypothetical protein FWC20_04380, partial [Oscillospiraceae bacterium]|nr:hypothetical protein [Oscillospiraceae bacterium]MCL2278629.1 hypothetical protein [Oscillospiraceae bacterium]